MLARVRAAAVLGVQAFPVLVEADLQSGLPTFSILQKRFHEERHRLHSAIHGMRQGTGDVIHIRRNQLSVCVTKFSSSVRAYLQEKGSRLSHFEQAVRLLDPINILKRGYSITYHKDKTVKDTEKIKNGDILITKVYKGTIKSTVEAKDEE